MRIVHVATEVFPVAKVGGLGDVIYGLAKETAKQATVDIILPRYASIDLEMELLPKTVNVTDGSTSFENKIYQAKLGSINLLFIEPVDHPKEYFSRGSIYGQPDDIDRFLYFSFAAANFIREEGTYDAVHLHDWATGIVPSLLQEMHTVFTIHNLHHQGLCDPSHLKQLHSPHTLDTLMDKNRSDTINLMQAGILHARHITTVSPTYAKEILDEPVGSGLSPLLQEKRDRLCGILNGLDETYHPETDNLLKYNYPSSSHEIENVIEGKKKNQTALFKELGLMKGSGPTVCAISRLVDQKGPELIQYAIDYTMEHDGNFLLLGSSHDEAIMQTFQMLAEKYTKSQRASFHFTFNEELARNIFASSDLLVVPSSFEPCGLTQMIGMRYGTVPIVFSTGGLCDTVNQDNGFLFVDYTAKAFHHALDAAFDADLTPLIQSGLSSDFSWHLPAKKYMKLYAAVDA